MNLNYLVIVCLFALFHFSRGQGRPLIRPHVQSSVPCYGDSYEDGYDSVDEERTAKTVLLAAAGGAALGYHLGNKNKNQPTINNNIYNDYPAPCVVVQSGGGGGGILGGGGLLSHHPILSNLIHGGLWGGGGGGGGGSGWGGNGGNRVRPAVTNRGQNINWNRAIRQFSRVVRPITRGFR